MRRSLSCVRRKLSKFLNEEGKGEENDETRKLLISCLHYALMVGLAIFRYQKGFKFEFFASYGGQIDWVLVDIPMEGIFYPCVSSTSQQYLYCRLFEILNIISTEYRLSTVNWHLKYDFPN